MPIRTPRTDREIAIEGSLAKRAANKVNAEFARKLERENIRLRKILSLVVTASIGYIEGRHGK